MSNPETQKDFENETLSEKKPEKGEVLSLKKAKEALIHSERLKTKFLFAINKINNHPLWHSKVVDGFWNKLSPEDRKELYKGGEPGIFKMLKKGIMPFNLMPSMKYKDNRLKFLGDKISESARSLVQLDMLPAPEGISSEEIAKDVLSDKKSLKHILTLVQVLVDLFAPEIAAEVGEAKLIANQLVDMRTDMATQQQERKAA